MIWWYTEWETVHPQYALDCTRKALESKNFPVNEKLDPPLYVMSDKSRTWFFSVGPMAYLTVDIIMCVSIRAIHLL